MILAGIDEAGYGPLLGPLVVSISIFRVPGDAPPDLWELLSPAVTRSARGKGIPINDSKKLFRQKGRLTRLEEGIFPFLHVRHGDVPRDIRSLLKRVARRGRGSADAYLDAYDWYRTRNVDLPRDTFTPVIRRLADGLQERMTETQVEFLGLASVPMEVGEFNAQLTALGGKAKVSFSAISHFLGRVWKQFGDEPTCVVVDRQGGRSHYAPILFEALQPRGIHIDEQTSERSSYRLARRGSRAGTASFQIEFLTGSEEKYLPVALASMLSKYLRELHMMMFNAFWVEHRGDLKPTAGYVTDGRRFLEDTRDLRKTLGVDEKLLIRRR